MVSPGPGAPWVGWRTVSGDDQEYRWCRSFHYQRFQESIMNNIIYIVGLVVVVLFVAGFLGLR
jgi:hypothetical protein